MKKRNSFCVICLFLVYSSGNQIMVVHVGVESWWGNLACYDVERNHTDYFEITKVTEYETKNIASMFNQIISKINGIPGYICLYVDLRYDNNARKKFIEEGYKSGFKNVQIINFRTAMYLNAMSQIDYKPLIGDVIWIYDIGWFYVWHMNEEKALFICRQLFLGQALNELQKTLKKSNLYKGPDIVLLNKDIEQSGIRNLSPTCKFFSYRIDNCTSYGSLIKARMTAGDPVFKDLETYIMLSARIIVKLDETDIVKFEDRQILPITYSKLIKKQQSNALKVFNNCEEAECFELPKWDEIYLTFKVDTNGIYSVEFDEKPPENKHKNDAPKFSAITAQSPLLKNTIVNTTKNYKILKIMPPFNAVVNTTGIDLGTSRCCVAVNRNIGIQTIPLDNTGERLLPSYVAFDEEIPKCGTIVIERLRHFSKSTIFDSKRIIGRNFGEIEIDQFWPFEILEMKGKVNLGIQKFDGKGHVSAEEVSGVLLKLIKQKAEEFQGTKLTDAVITVPAAFTKAQSAVTMEAARLAGWDKVKLLPEPIAAAFAYFMDRPIPNDTNILLFDLGGGTLDVCTFKIENDEIQIISNTGDTKLGGRDFDTILINHFKNALITKYGISVKSNKKYLLMIKCQKIKESLSMLKSGSLDIDDFDPSQDGIITINRDEFQKMAEPLLNKIKNTIQSALFQSNCKPGEINKVLQVGGGSRMPMIKELLQKMFPKAEQCCEEHPDEVVAIGAAYYAYSLLSQPSVPADHA